MPIAILMCFISTSWNCRHISSLKWGHSLPFQWLIRHEMCFVSRSHFNTFHDQFSLVWYKCKICILLLSSRFGSIPVRWFPIRFFGKAIVYSRNSWLKIYIIVIVLNNNIWVWTFYHCRHTVLVIYMYIVSINIHIYRFTLESTSLI